MLIRKPPAFILYATGQGLRVSPIEVVAQGVSMKNAGSCQATESRHEALIRWTLRVRLAGLGDPPAFAPEPPFGPLFPGDLKSFQQTIDGLPEHIALLDSDWTILTINEAWRRAAVAAGQTALTPGQNYRDFCRAHAEANADAAAVTVALKQMEEGRRTRFRHLYSATGPSTGRDYEVCITRIESAGRRLAIVARYDVTALRDFECEGRELGEEPLPGQGQEHRGIAPDPRNTISPRRMARNRS